MCATNFADRRNRSLLLAPFKRGALRASLLTRIIALLP